MKIGTIQIYYFKAILFILIAWYNFTRIMFGNETTYIHITDSTAQRSDKRFEHVLLDNNLRC